MLELFGRYPTRSNRAQWALEELEVPYVFYQIDFAAGDASSDYFLALNPGGKIPVLRDGELVITESAAICNYLGEKFPDSNLTPSGGTAARAKYDQWMFFVLSELEQPMWTKAKHKFALPKAQRLEGLNPTAEWEFNRAASILAKGLGESEFILGERFTMADILITHTLSWAKVANFEIGQQNLIDYTDRNLARPAVKRMAKKEKNPLPK